jgi:hypothetical protein
MSGFIPMPIADAHGLRSVAAHQPQLPRPILMRMPSLDGAAAPWHQQSHRGRDAILADGDA